MNLEQSILQIPVEDIIPNRFQPRLNFEDRGLEELANSIRQHGIIQPLVLRRLGDKYEIIAGERRYKASIMAGLKTVPAVIAQIDDNKSAEVAIVENVQRRDLSPIEEARSYKKILDKGYLTQSELAKRMGISQSAIANKLRLLNLDESVQEALINNEISERHARSLLLLNSHEEQKKWLMKIIKERLTVRELDEALKKYLTPDTDNDESDIPLVAPLDIEAIRKEATELPSVNEDSDIARKIKEIEREKMYNPDIIPVDQASNNSKNNFFNFLENETVNMNLEENDVEAPINFDLIPKFEDAAAMQGIPPKNEEPQNLTAPAIDINANYSEAPTIDSEFVANPKEVEPPKEAIPESPKPTPKTDLPNLNPNFGSSASSEPTNENFDPVNLIETLDPNYETKQEAKLGIDLKTAINTIRDAKDSLSAKGFNISLEETDMQDSYQFTIKIKKN